MKQPATTTEDLCGRPKLEFWQVVLGVFLAATSGAAILAHVFLSLPMQFTVPFVVMPAVFFLLFLILRHRHLHSKFRIATYLLLVGAIAGLGGTIVYDISRPLVKLIFGFKLNPFVAMPLFGSLMTGKPVDSLAAKISGWVYHFWNGISFGMMFALIRPVGGLLAGLLWGLVLQTLMFVTYPRLLGVRMDDPGFVAMGIIGHGLWGVVLGYGVKRWSTYA